MLVVRKRTPANVVYRHGRMQELDRVWAPSSADLVVSRAVFHWIPLADYPRCDEAVPRATGVWLEHGTAGLDRRW